MADGIDIKLHGSMSGWGRLLLITDPVKFGKLLNSNMRKGLTAATLDVERDIRDSIRTDGEYAANSPMTVAMKGSTRPLVDTGHNLMRSITRKVHSATHAEVGVNFRAESGANIARALHDGFSLDLSDPKYAKLRYWLIRKRQELVDEGKLAFGPARAGAYKPGFLVVPGRPFFTRVFRSKKTRDRVMARLGAAFGATLHGQVYSARGRRAPGRAS